jgi:SAM-dependent methyltransferase
MRESIDLNFDPDLRHPSYFFRKRLLNGIRQHAPALKGRLLDFGCGSKPYQSLFEVDEYVGLDYAGPGHSHDNETIDVYYDGRIIPLEAATFDCIFSSEVFEHIFNLPEILPELYRVMKPGAIILVTCPFAIGEHEIPNDFARYSSFALREMMTKNGFEVVAQEKLGNSIEVVFQLAILYIHQSIAPKFRTIPLVRSIFRCLIYPFMNVSALILGGILPKGEDLYLSNLILCRKRL